MLNFTTNALQYHHHHHHHPTTITTTTLDELYPKLFAEFRRLLKPGGVLVALTTLRQVVTEIVAVDDGWEPRERRQVFVGGLKAYMYTVRKRP